MLKRARTPSEEDSEESLTTPAHPPSAQPLRFPNRNAAMLDDSEAETTMSDDGSPQPEVTMRLLLDDEAAVSGGDEENEAEADNDDDAGGLQGFVVSDGDQSDEGEGISPDLLAGFEGMSGEDCMESLTTPPHSPSAQPLRFPDRNAAMHDESEEETMISDDGSPQPEVTMRLLLDDEAAVSDRDEENEIEEDNDDDAGSLRDFIVSDGDQGDEGEEGISPDLLAGFEEEGHRLQQIARGLEERHAGELDELDSTDTSEEETGATEASDGSLCSRANELKDQLCKGMTGLLRRLEVESRQEMDRGEGFTPQFAYGFSNNLDRRTLVIKKAQRAKWVRQVSEVAAQATRETGEDVRLEYVLNPSSLAEYFSGHQCEANLVISNLAPESNASTWRSVSNGLLEGGEEGFRAMAWVEREMGKAYEAEVVDKIERKGYVVRSSSQTMPDGINEQQPSARHGWTHSTLMQSIERCQVVGPSGSVEFIYQAVLPIDARCLGVPANVRGFTAFKPDLIEVTFLDNKIRLKLIEIKACEATMPKHRVQLGLYSIMMQSWIDRLPSEQRLQVELDASCAGVWLLDARWYEPTIISTLAEDLRHFLQRDLAPILSMPDRAARCGQCYVCRRLAEAMRATGSANLVDDGASLRLADLTLTRLVNGYDMSILRQCRELLFQSQDEPTVDQLVRTLPPLCTIIMVGPGNDPMQMPLHITGVEVDNDPGWAYKLWHLQEGHDAQNACQPLLHERTVCIVVTNGTIKGVCGPDGESMAFHCVFEDHCITGGAWQGSDPRVCELLDLERQADGISKLIMRAPQNFPRSPPPFILVLLPCGRWIVGAVNKGSDMANIMVLVPETITRDWADGRIQVSVKLRVCVDLCLRRIALMKLDGGLTCGSTSARISASPRHGMPPGPYELEVMTVGHRRYLRADKWNQEARTFELQPPFEGEEDVPHGEIIRFREGQGGLTQNLKVSGVLHAYTCPGGILRAYVLVEEEEEGVRPFTARKLAMRRMSCALSCELFRLSTAQELRGVPQHSDLVWRHFDSDAARLDAALLRIRVRSMFDRGIRIISDADTDFPHIQPNVEILITGMRNRFLALAKESYFVCATVNVRVYYDRKRVYTGRFSSLDHGQWRSDGRDADRFLIITLYHIFKAVEKANETGPITVQTYTYDIAFAEAVRMMLSDSFCYAGGLSGARETVAETEGPVSLWDMTQYLCLVVTPTLNGILAEDGPSVDKKARLVRTSALLPITSVVKRVLALPSLHDDPLEINAVLEALGAKAMSCETLDELLERRIIRRWAPGQLSSYDKAIHQREKGAWKVVSVLRQTLRFFQVDVAPVFATTGVSPVKGFSCSTLARLAFMVHHEVEVALETKEQERRVHPTKQLAAEMASQVRLLCYFTPPERCFEDMSIEERKELLNRYFKDKKRIFPDLFRHVFGNSIQVPDDKDDMACHVAECYDRRQKDVESFVSRQGKKNFRDYLEDGRPYFILQVTGGRAAFALLDNKLILVEASAEGRASITGYRDDVMTHWRDVPSSYNRDGKHIVGRRLACCRLGRVCKDFDKLGQQLGLPMETLVCVPDHMDTFKTRDVARRTDDDGVPYAESGWSILRDRAPFVEVNRRSVTEQQALERLEHLVSMSRANYLLFEPLSGYSLPQQRSHLIMLRDEPVEERVLLQIMSDPNAYNVAHVCLPVTLENVGHLTRTQHEAAHLIREKACTTVRGPPGTGKTQFIASCILGIRTEARALMVGVTAHQRAGIGTLVRRLLDLAQTDDIHIIAVASDSDNFRDWKLPEGKVECERKSDFGRAAAVANLCKMMQTRRVVVVAGTVWQLESWRFKMHEKITKGDDKFGWDLLVLDEASQMPVLAASCVVQGIRRTKGAHGRLVLVGDEHQLPPVIKGKYAERTVAFHKYYTNFAAYLPSCAEGGEVSEGSLCVGCSAFNRGMVIHLLTCWGLTQQPRFGLIAAGDGTKARTLRPMVGQIFESFETIVEGVTVVGDLREHFFRRNMTGTDHLPIERSIFECLRISDELSRQVGGGRGSFVQLDETFRMNRLLASVFTHIYETEDEVVRFSAVEENHGGHANMLLSVDPVRLDSFLKGLSSLSKELKDKLYTILGSRTCLVTVELQGLQNHQLTRPASDGAECAVLILLIKALYSSYDGNASTFASEGCFINTPMNRQRRALTEGLRKCLPADLVWNVATVDKMQGQEAECVLSAYAYSDSVIDTNPQFLYSRNRINVALSRAMCKAVLVVSQQMLKIRSTMLQEDPTIATGYAMFRHVYNMCEAGSAVGGQQAVLVQLTQEDVIMIQKALRLG